MYKYLAVWKLGEGPNVLSGLGYNGVDPASGTPQWDGVTNVHCLKFDFAQSLDEVRRTVGVGGLSLLLYINGITAWELQSN